MTVSEMIAKLAMFPPSATIYFVEPTGISPDFRVMTGREFNAALTAERGFGIDDVDPDDVYLI